MTFIAKFVGGCSFVLINAAYLVVGLWLLLGFRFGVWKPTLLWSIPIFLFSFAIFYSVSALSGLVWRNTVMAIAATIVFWFCCKAVAITKEGIEQLAVVPDRITQIATHDDELFVNRRSGGMAVWNAETGSLEEIMASKVAPQGAEMMMGGRNPFSGFHYDADEGRLIALDRNWNRSKLITGRRENGFKREQEIAGPRNARGLFAVDGQLLTVGNGGIYVLSIPEPKDASADVAADEKVNDETDEPKAINIFGLKLGGKKPEKPEDPFQRISDDIGPLSGDARVAFDESNADLFIHGGRTLKRYGRSDGFYTGKKTVELRELKEVLNVQAGGGTVAIASRKDEQIHLKVLDGNSLAPRFDIATNEKNELRALDVSNDGQFVACLYDNDHLTVYELKDEPQAITSIPSQDYVAGMQFSHDRLIIADGSDRIIELSLPDLSRKETRNPKLPLIRRIYGYAVRPLYLIFPKPAELQNTMQYAITGKDTVKVEGPGMGPGGRTIKLNPWEPLTSNSVFIGVMLLIGCLYVYRQDF